MDEAARKESDASLSSSAATSALELKKQLDYPSAEIIWARSVEVFGNQDKARIWMNQPRSTFGNRSPQQIASHGTTAEQHMILASLVALDYGLFS